MEELPPPLPFSQMESTVPLVPGSRPVPMEGEVEFNPPLGSVPEFTASIPILQNASARWATGGGSIRLLGMLRDGQNVNALRSLIVATAAMFIFPLIVMALAYALLPVAPENRIVCAGLAAIGAVQIVIVGFLVHAFTEDTSLPTTDANTSKKTA